MIGVFLLFYRVLITRISPVFSSSIKESKIIEHGLSYNEKERGEEDHEIIKIYELVESYLAFLALEPVYPPLCE